MEKNLKEAEKVLHSMTNIIPDIIYRLDKNGRITFISHSVTQYGYEQKELLGTNILEIVHPEDRDKACYRINERRTGKRCTKSIELRLLTKEEETVHFEKRSKANGDFAVFLINAEGLYASATPPRRGRELVEKLEKMHPKTKVLYMSGHTDDSIARHGILEPGIAFMQKPFSPEDLAGKVRQILDSGSP